MAKLCYFLAGEALIESQVYTMMWRLWLVQTMVLSPFWLIGPAKKNIC